VGIDKFEDYLVLGDDVVIAHHEVADSYISLMTEVGVSISIPKSIQPGPPKGVEFASKLITEEEDLSPLPLGCLKTKTILSIFTL
jgi:hypothetical protein